MSIDPRSAAAFVEAYGLRWESWDVEAFVEIFSEDVVYVAHPEEIVVGREALRRYLEKEAGAQGEVSVQMGKPLVDGDQVIGEFWVQATNDGENASIAGCLIARLDGPGGPCTHFREYWFDLEGHKDPFDGWGT
jgi:ketosteroid isomerase-like protein